MIFVQTGTPVNIYLSSLKGSLGGEIGGLASNSLTVTFDKTKSFYGGKEYKFLYFKFDRKSENAVRKIQVFYRIDYLSVSDFFDFNFLSNVSVKFFVLPEWRKNVIHDKYNRDGFSLTTRKQIDDLIPETQNYLSLDLDLRYLDFYPFGMIIESFGPVERVFNLPLILEITAFFE